MDVNNTSQPPCSDLFTDLIAFLHLTNGTETSSSKYGISFAIITIISSVVIIVNLGTLLAISQIHKLSAYLRLVISLSLSNVLVGVRVLFGSLDIQPLSGSHVELCLFICLRDVKMTSHLISLFNLLGLGLDHYCAIVRPMTYRSQMSTTKSNLMILTFWTVSVLFGFSNLFLPTSQHSHCSERVNYTSCADTTSDNVHQMLQLLNISSNISDDALKLLLDTSTNDQYEILQSDYDSLPDDDGGFCYSVWCSQYDTEYLVFLIAALLLLAMFVIYIRVCVKIYSMNNLLRGRHRRRLKQNKKGLITTLCIVGTFMVCWLPFCIFTIVTLFNMSSNSDSTINSFKISMQLDSYLYALLLLNSLCDPMIYALRMREVKRGYNRLIGKLFKTHRYTTSSTSRYSSSSQMTSSHESRLIHTNELTSPRESRLIHTNDLSMRSSVT